MSCSNNAFLERALTAFTENDSAPRGYFVIKRAPGRALMAVCDCSIIDLEAAAAGLLEGARQMAETENQMNVLARVEAALTVLASRPVVNLFVAPA